jgi:hypothetical protein
MQIISRIALALSLLASTGSVLAADLVGRASIIDGDTLEIHGTRIRLWGIDAPESTQLCRDQDSEHALPLRHGYRRSGSQVSMMLSRRSCSSSVSRAIGLPSRASSCRSCRGGRRGLSAVEIFDPVASAKSDQASARDVECSVRVTDLAPQMIDDRPHIAGDNAAEQPHDLVDSDFIRLHRRQVERRLRMAAGLIAARRQAEYDFGGLQKSESSG